MTAFLTYQSVLLSNTPRFRYLATFFTCNTISQLDDLIWMHDLWKYSPWLVNAYIPFLFLLTPSIYYYIRILTNAEVEPKIQKYIKLWGGFFVAAFLCLPYFLLDNEIKIERLSEQKGSLQHLSYITYLPIFALIIYIPFSFTYLCLTFMALTKNLVNIKAYFSNLKNKDLSWIRWMMLVLTLAFAVSTLYWFLPENILGVGIDKTVFTITELCWIASFGHLAMRQSPINVPNKTNEQAKKRAYLKSKIGIEDRLRIERKLVNAMANHQLHRDPMLTLGKLSTKTSITENNISQVLNQVMKQNFYDFVNSWRIKDASSKLENKNINLLQVAYESGFNSRSTFNTAFKKHTGKTPSDFRSELLKNL